VTTGVSRERAGGGSGLQPLASGRECEIFEAPGGLVCRRSRQGQSQRVQAQTMEYARAHDYPVPTVVEVSADGTELLLERVDGPSMLEVLWARPWEVGRHARLLADLHRRLHELDAPDWLQPVAGGAGGRLLHLDLHPGNVLMSSQGPVVIDWSCAAGGDPFVDVAMSWLLMATGDVPSSRLRAMLLSPGRARLVGCFLTGFDRDAVRERLPYVIERKLNDTNMTSAEHEAMRKLARVTQNKRRRRLLKRR
jgi:Phosphotransferase enzyme family